MSTRAGVGYATALKARDAAFEAATSAVSVMADGEPDALLVFFTCGYAPSEVIAGLRAVAPKAKIGGCSGEGIIARAVSDEGLRALCVLAIRSDAFAFEPMLVEGYGADSRAAGRALVEQVNAADAGDAVGLLLFPDGLVGDCRALLGALDAALPKRIKIVGGAAGDPLVFDKTWQVAGDSAITGGVAAVLVRATKPGARLAIGVSHGCEPIGLPRVVTDADGGWLRGIDGLPAWSVVRQYLDGEPEEFSTEGASLLSVGEALPHDEAAAYEPFIIHTPLGHDKDTGALFFPGGGLVSGTPIRMTRRDPEKIRDGAARCAERVAAAAGSRSPAIVFQFDCAGRGRQLFSMRAAANLIEPMQAVLGESTPWIGFHSYGEIAPVLDVTRYHNFTVALCALFDP
jgi:hypothetical protein